MLFYLMTHSLCTWLYLTVFLHFLESVLECCKWLCSCVPWNLYLTAVPDCVPAFLRIMQTDSTTLWNYCHISIASHWSVSDWELLDMLLVTSEPLRLRFWPESSTPPFPIVGLLSQLRLSTPIRSSRLLNYVKLSHNYGSYDNWRAEVCLLLVHRRTPRWCNETRMSQLKLFLVWFIFCITCTRDTFFFGIFLILLPWHRHCSSSCFLYLFRGEIYSADIINCSISCSHIWSYHNHVGHDSTSGLQQLPCRFFSQLDRSGCHSYCHTTWSCWVLHFHCLTQLSRSHAIHRQ